MANWMPTFNAVWEFFWIFLEITEKPLIALGIYYPTPPPSGPSLEETAVFYRNLLQKERKVWNIFFCPTIVSYREPWPSTKPSNSAWYPVWVYTTVLNGTSQKRPKNVFKVRLIQSYLENAFWASFFVFHLLSISRF